MNKQQILYWLICFLFGHKEIDTGAGFCECRRCRADECGWLDVEVDRWYKAGYLLKPFKKVKNYLQDKIYERRLKQAQDDDGLPF